MSLGQIVNPFTPLVGLTGVGLTGGLLYVGLDGQDPETNPQPCFWDAGGTIPASQPIDVVGGYPMRLGTPAQVYTAATYSMRVRDRLGVQVFYVASVVAGASSSTGQQDVELLSFVPEAQWPAILAGTSTYDCATALRNAIASVSVPVPGFAQYIGGPKVILPYGVCCINSTIELKKTVTIEGRSGGGMPWGFGSSLKFPADTIGFIVQAPNTTGSGTGATTTGGNNSVFRNFSMVSAGGSDVTKHGIWMRARATILDVNIQNFPGTAINIVATAGGGGALEGNANNWHVERCRLEDGGLHGLFVDGADVNAGTAIGVDASANGGWGIWDSSFLGNTYVGCHTASNILGAYKTDGASAQNVLLGCYSEGGQPASSLISPTLVVGGLHGAGFTAGSSASYLASTGNGATFNHGVLDKYDDGAGNILLAQIGGEGTSGTVLYTSKTTDAPLPWRFRWSGGNLILDYGNLGTTVAWTITGEATTRDFGRSAIQPRKFAVDNFFIGPGNNARQHTSGTAAPATGSWGRGDICYNIQPSAGGKLGWVCTTAGTPGTWKAFGVIDP